MKKLYVAVALCFILVGCSKSDNPKPNNVDSRKVCNQLTQDIYDANGNITQSLKYYYSNNRLDSVVANATGAKQTTIYIYSNAYQRRVEFYVSGVKQSNFVTQKLDSEGNVIESQSSQPGTGKVVYTYSCN